MPTVAPQDVPQPDVVSSSDVERLLALGKVKQAVERAKDEHKAQPTPETERRLVAAYVARIEQLQAKGMSEEAGSLIALVTSRFPAQKHQLDGQRTRNALAQGLLGELFAPLADPSTPPERVRELEQVIRTKLTDLPGLAACASLPLDHPLRLAANALWQAFQAVTSRPVEEAEVALSMVSHRSPLSNWKLLIRGIAAFYREDDDAARRFLNAVAEDSAVKGVARMIVGLTNGVMEKAGRSAVLCAKLVPAEGPLRSALAQVDRALSTCDESLLKRSVRDALERCQEVRPSLANRLKQHIHASCAVVGVPTDLTSRLVRDVPVDAYYWRLMAKAIEISQSSPVAALYWHRFVKTASVEGLFAERSPEAAAVWAHIGSYLALLRPRVLESERRLMESEFAAGRLNVNIPGLKGPLVTRDDINDLTDAHCAFARSTELSPRVETFRTWWAQAERSRASDKQKEAIASAWHDFAPADGEALLHLAALAEGRNALTLAAKWIAEAERVDPINPSVRQSRARLTLSITWRHFSTQKTHLIEQDLVALRVTPRHARRGPGGGRGVHSGVWHAQRGDKPAAAASFDTARRQLGSLAASALLDLLATTAKVARNDNWPDAGPEAGLPAVEFAQAAARLARVADLMSLGYERPAAWSAPLREALLVRPSPISISDLLVIARSEVEDGDFRLSYSATTAGLLRSDARRPRRSSSCCGRGACRREPCRSAPPSASPRRCRWPVPPMTRRLSPPSLPRRSAPASG